MISAILEASNGRIVGIAGQPGNEEYLCQKDPVRFPYLSQVDCISYAIFICYDMQGLLVELGSLSPPHGEDVAAIMALAERCRSEPDYSLSFTPFGE